MADYDVVLLVEQALSARDAARIRSLHEGLEDPVTYHLLLPVEDAAAQIETSLGSLTGGEPVATPSVGAAGVGMDLEALQEDHEHRAAGELARSCEVLTAAGAMVGSSALIFEPIDDLATTVANVDGQEAIILTRPHVVAEFFHVDWTSKARRAMGVPVLHLIEHETFDEQAGGGEGIHGL